MQQWWIVRGWSQQLLLQLPTGIYWKFPLQTLTSVLITHAVMVDRVKIESTVTFVTALKDILEITVKQVNFCFGVVFRLFQVPWIKLI